MFMIDNKKINFLFLGIACLEIVTIILGFIVGTSFYFCLKPFIYVGLAIFVYLFLDRKYVVKPYKNYVNQIVVMGAIAYILLYILSGIIFGFSYNPLVTKGKFFFLNIVYYIPTAVSIEFIRYHIISFVDKKYRFRYMILLSIIFAFSMSNISLSMFLSVDSVVKLFYQLLVPNFVIGCFLSYVALYGSLWVSILYVLIPIVYNLFVRIVPNPQWIIPVIIKTFIPFSCYLLIKGVNVSVKKDKKLKKNKNVLFGYIGISLMIFMILFACGIFRIYPVAIASNSMMPSFGRGDIQIVDKKKQVYEVDDVIQFYGLNDTVFVHRVVSVRRDGKNVYYTTKGDNNDTVDLMEISQSRVIGKSILTLKYLGYPTVWITEFF